MNPKIKCIYYADKKEEAEIEKAAEVYGISPNEYMAYRLEGKLPPLPFLEGVARLRVRTERLLDAYQLLFQVKLQDALSDEQMQEFDRDFNRMIQYWKELFDTTWDNESA